MPRNSTEGPVTPTVVLEEPSFAVVNKPAGMPVQADTTGDPDLLGWARAHWQDAQFELVNRIDRPVSGAVLLAREASMLAALNEAFRERRVEKVYWAIVQGAVKVPTEGMLLQDRLSHDTREHKARVLPEEGSEGEWARLRIRALAVGDRLSLLEVRPEGGAFHQIRAQLAAWGHPIQGDVKYGARRGERDRSILLHARSLTFAHPDTGHRILAEAPAPVRSPWPAFLALAGL